MPVMTEVAPAEQAQAFDGFFDGHYERLVRAMYLSTGDRYEAEDLAQEAMARVYERWERVRETEDPLGYLYRVALNARRSRLRRVAVAARSITRSGRRQESHPTNEADDRQAIMRALRQLPPAQRDAVVVCDWLEMTDTEAAEVLGVSAGAVRARLHRARPKLREALRGERDG